MRRVDEGWPGEGDQKGEGMIVGSQRFHPFESSGSVSSTTRRKGPFDKLRDRRLSDHEEGKKNMKKNAGMTLIALDKPYKACEK
jgi:hypothetical protein